MSCLESVEHSGRTEYWNGMGYSLMSKLASYFMNTWISDADY